jgi:hypothetical protein
MADKIHLPEGAPGAAEQSAGVNRGGAPGRRGRRLLAGECHYFLGTVVRLNIQITNQRGSLG